MPTRHLHKFGIPNHHAVDYARHEEVRYADKDEGGEVHEVAEESRHVDEWQRDGPGQQHGEHEGPAAREDSLAQVVLDDDAVDGDGRHVGDEREQRRRPALSQL